MPPMLVVTLGTPAIDDAGYLRALIEEIGRRFAVDRKAGLLDWPFERWLDGLSDGLPVRRSHRRHRRVWQACRFWTPAVAHPSEPVNILHIHGTADTTDPYIGGALNSPPFPGEYASISWRHCGPSRSGPVTTARATPSPIPRRPWILQRTCRDSTRLSLATLPARSAAPSNCATINGGSHIPTLSSEFSPWVIDWLLAHPKP